MVSNNKKLEIALWSAVVISVFTYVAAAYASTKPIDLAIMVFIFTAGFAYFSMVQAK